ncbi:MAG TPA: glycosyltransferase [Mycobacteriales bacterium]|nr:glycosyltransferase [Mycobacteriales bacterium]
MTDGAAVAVVITTYGRADLLPRLATALDAQEVDGPVEVVVYDDASVDDTPRVLAEWAARARHPVTVLRGEANRGPSAGRNAGWRATTAPLVVFTDDDCVPAPGWLAAHVAAAAGATRVSVGRTQPAESQRAHEGPFSRTLRVDDARYFQTCNVAYPRALLERLEGFDEELRTGEDVDMGLRATEAGAGVVFTPEAFVEHDVRPSSLALALRDATRWVDIPRVVRKHPAARREYLHRSIFWKVTHLDALLLVAGAALARRQPLALALALPWLRRRSGPWRPAGTSTRRLVVSLPGLLAVDLVETATMVRGSIKHRSPML